MSDPTPEDPPKGLQSPEDPTAGPEPEVMSEQGIKVDIKEKKVAGDSIISDQVTINYNAYLQDGGKGESREKTGEEASPLHEGVGISLSALPNISQKISFDISQIKTEKIENKISILKSEGIMVIRSIVPETAIAISEYLSRHFSVNTTAGNGNLTNWYAKARLPRSKSDTQEKVLGLEDVLREVAGNKESCMVFMDTRELPQRESHKIGREAELCCQDDRDRVLSAPLDLANKFLIISMPPDDSTQIDHETCLVISEAEEVELYVNSICSLNRVSQDIDEKSRVRQQLTSNIGFWGNGISASLRNVADLLLENDLHALDLSKLSDDPQRDMQDYTAKVAKLIDPNNSSITGVIDGLTREYDESQQVVCDLIAYTILVLTQFDEITKADFNWIMKELLSDEVRYIREEVVKRRKISQKQNKEESNSEVKEEFIDEEISYEEKRISLMDKYEFHIDSFLKNLDVLEQTNGALGFNPAYKKGLAEAELNDRRSMFKEKALIDKSINSAMLLFTRNEHIAERFAVLYAKYLQMQSGQGRGVTLLDWYETSSKKMESHSSQVDDLPEMHIIKPVVFASRFSLILIELMEKTETKSAVHDFLSALMRPYRHFDNVFNLVLQLNYVSDFDTTYWLKRLLSEGSEEIKSKSMHALISTLDEEVRWSVQSSRPFFSELKEWIPEDTLQVEGFNNMAAVLLLPRLALYEQCRNVKTAKIGKIDKLVPFFDLDQENHLYAEIDDVIQLITMPITGSWIRTELNEVQKLMAFHWELQANRMFEIADFVLQDDFKRIIDDFPVLVAIDSRFLEYGTDYSFSRHFCICVMLVEAISVFIEDPDDLTTQRGIAVQNLLKKIADRLSLDELDAVQIQSEDFQVKLAETRRKSVANLITDTFYSEYKARV